MSGSWQAEQVSRRTRRHPRNDPRAEVGEDVRVGVVVGVRVGPVEFQLYSIFCNSLMDSSGYNAMFFIYLFGPQRQRVAYEPLIC